MALASAFYNTIARRNSVFVTSIFASTFLFTIGFDQGLDKFWDTWNKGRQWKDIRHKYIDES